MQPNGYFQIKALKLLASGHRVSSGVNLAALNYHFGSRLAFIQAVIKRRVEPINAHRWPR